MLVNMINVSVKQKIDITTVEFAKTVETVVNAAGFFSLTAETFEEFILIVLHKIYYVKLFVKVCG